MAQRTNGMARGSYGALSRRAFVAGAGLLAAAVLGGCAHRDEAQAVGADGGSGVVGDPAAAQPQGAQVDAQVMVPAGGTVADATVDPLVQQTFYLWEAGAQPATTVYDGDGAGRFDGPDFRPSVTSYPVGADVDPKGAVLLCSGGAFQARSDGVEGSAVARELAARGYQAFVVDYRLRPYTQQEGALDLARAVRFVCAHASEYRVDPAAVAVMGFSAGGILAGEMVLNWADDVTPDALDPAYAPDDLDAVSAAVAACGMVYAFYGRLSVAETDPAVLAGAIVPTYYCYGTEDPFFEQFEAQYALLEQAGEPVDRQVLQGWGHGYGARGGWVDAYDAWLAGVFASLPGAGEKPAEGKSSGEDPAGGASSSVLVAYFSATGNTARVAQLVAAELGTDVFVIEPAEPYTAADLDYNDPGSRVCAEHNDPQRHVGLRAAVPPNLDAYATVLVGYPIWWQDFSWVLADFAAACDFVGKTVCSFCTSQESGLGASAQNLAAAVGGGDWRASVRFPSNVGDDEVRAWAAGLGL